MVVLHVALPLSLDFEMNVIHTSTSPLRTRWRSKGAFLLISFGVGCSSFFRFPYVAIRYGGAAFVLCYVCCILGVGLPLLILELAVGQLFQRGQIKALHSESCPRGVLP